MAPDGRQNAGRGNFPLWGVRGESILGLCGGHSGSSGERSCLGNSLRHVEVTLSGQKKVTPTEIFAPDGRQNAWRGNFPLWGGEGEEHFGQFWLDFGLGRAHASREFPETCRSDIVWLKESHSDRNFGTKRTSKFWAWEFSTLGGALRVKIRQRGYFSLWWLGPSGQKF